MEIKNVFPLHITTMVIARVNLFHITAGETFHYALVKDLSRLVMRQYNNDCHKKYFCRYCLHGCTSEEVLKTIWKDASYIGRKDSSSPKVTTKRGLAKSNLQKKNANYIYLLSSRWILKTFYVNKSRVSHHHQNPSPPNTNITYHLHLREIQLWVIIWTTPKWYGRWQCWKDLRPGTSRSNHL